MEQTRGIRNNNPFNIIYIKSNTWLGKRLPNQDGRFEQFTEMDYGIRAGICLFRNYIRRYHLKTPRQMLMRFAPSFENDFQAYCDFLIRYGVALDSLCTLYNDNFYYFIKGICWYESRFVLTDFDIHRIIKKFKLY